MLTCISALWFCDLVEVAYGELCKGGGKSGANEELTFKQVATKRRTDNEK